eukprot:CAMPEP_0184669626 /NCGR_PEP_ID=MMETSP0308-20130426/78296_1 /TAXON_ID=38269 /ORGANISM="Gloeochaete witrockiana, Strain SAG 46.84" /LENGTH=59 /DNA_ID=CAMNT_0027115993 /DNA_START=22 /DNA_END=201 /DNA_ORIENTATION=-
MPVQGADREAGTGPERVRLRESDMRGRVRRRGLTVQERVPLGRTHDGVQTMELVVSGTS